MSGIIRFWMAHLLGDDEEWRPRKEHSPLIKTCYIWESENDGG